MDSEPTQTSRPRALTDEEFNSYCSALYHGRRESEIMAEFGISRRQYWRVRSAAARRQNRELWAQAQACQEDTRRHEKRESLCERALRDRDTLGSVRAIRRFSAYYQYDQNRHLSDPPPS
jgi:hypothetical protein